MMSIRDGLGVSSGATSGCVAEHDQVEFQEVKLAMLEKQNWLLKGTRFLKRKFFKSARPFQE